MKQNVESCILYMDAGLADIMADNLLKNAVKHNVDNGFIVISLTQSSLTIENTGIAYQGNPNTLFERFIIGTSGSMGIGLAIVKQICEVYNFKISYNVDGNVHKIQIRFSV